MPPPPLPDPLPADAIHPGGIAPDALRREAMWRCHLCPGSGFASIGYPVLGMLYLLTSTLTLVACGIAVMSFAGIWARVAAVMILLLLVLYGIEILGVLRMKVRVQSRNRLRSAFVPLAVAEGALALTVAAMFFITSGTLRMQGHGMSPELQPGERLIYRKQVLSADLMAGMPVLFRLNPDNTWLKKRVLVTARIVALPGDKLARDDDHYLVNGQQTRQVVGAVGRYARAIEVPELPDSLVVPEDCYFIAQDNPGKSFDSQVLGWVLRRDFVSTDIRHLIKDGEVLEIVK